MSRPSVYVGFRKNKLTAIRFDHWQHGTSYWLFKCDCGNQKVIRGSSVFTGKTKSCGCLTKTLNSKRMITHGMSKTPLFNNWHSMKSRCNNPNATGFDGHGGRGIKICKEWMNDFKAFAEWSFKNGYRSGMQLDRIDNDGDYCPGNCQWLTRSEHTRKTHKELGDAMWKGFY